MRILRRIPAQYGILDVFTLDPFKHFLKFNLGLDLDVENVIYCNKPRGGIEMYNKKPVGYGLEDAEIVKLYPKKDVKLLLYDGRYDNIVKNIPIYLGDDSKKSIGREYTLDEMIKLFGKNNINYKCVSLDYEKLQAMGLDGVHLVNNDSTLFRYWASGSTIWFNTKWIKSIESVDEPHNKIVPWKVGKENG